MSSHVFGPVPSRRFGRSLGVNPVPFKTCNYSCIYCQLGKTSPLSIERKEYIGVSEIAEAVREAVDRAPGRIDFITFMGEGEPTLASNLGRMAREVRSFWDGRLALITNGSLFFLPEVRDAAGWFDIVSPTLSSGDEATYRWLHRPHRDCSLEKMVEGLRTFSKRFEGEIWIEVMLVRGVNDSPSSLEAIGGLIKGLRADRVYINTPIRPPSEQGVEPPRTGSLKEALRIIEGAIDLSSSESVEIPDTEDPESQLLAIAANHPLREDQAVLMLQSMVPPHEAIEVLARLVAEGRLERTRHTDIVFYRAHRGGD